MAGKSRQILAISNSSALFAGTGEPPTFARYLVELTGKDRPVICHVGAANGDSPEKAERFFALAMRAGFEARHLNLFALQDGNPATFFTGMDAVYIDGGSTRNLRAILREWSADAALKHAYDAGVALCGASAGANILFEWGMTDSIKTKIEATHGIGILRGSLSVHANIRADRNEALERHLAGPNAAYPAYMLDDFTALHFTDDRLFRVISTQAEASVHCQVGPGERVARSATTLIRDTASDTI